MGLPFCVGSWIKMSISELSEREFRFNQTKLIFTGDDPESWCLQGATNKPLSYEINSCEVIYRNNSPKQAQYKISQKTKHTKKIATSKENISAAGKKEGGETWELSRVELCAFVFVLLLFSHLLREHVRAVWKGVSRVFLARTRAFN